MKGENVSCCELSGNFFQISWFHCSGYWTSKTNNMAYAAVQCDKISFSKFWYYWALYHFNTLSLESIYLQAAWEISYFS